MAVAVATLPVALSNVAVESFCLALLAFRISP